jgi:DNA-binding transcriptional LysR family regulator
MLEERILIDRLDAMRVFLAALDEGSLAAAGKRLGRSDAAVSRAVAFLENHGGAQLMSRTTRQINLTAIGEEYAHMCRSVLAEIDEADLKAAGSHGSGREDFAAVITHRNCLFSSRQQAPLGACLS